MDIYKTAVSQFNGEENTLPTKLRPSPCFMESETEEQEDKTENIITNFSKLKGFIKKKCIKHRCRNKSSMNIAISNHMGTCISLLANCKKCHIDTTLYKV